MILTNKFGYYFEGEYMKIVIPTLLLLLAQSAFSISVDKTFQLMNEQSLQTSMQENTLTPSSINFTCVTEIPTTSAIVETEGNIVRLTILHHNGTDFAPFHNGAVTLSDIHFLEKKGMMLSRMGEKIELEYDIAKCKEFGDKQFSCYSSGKPQYIGDLLVKSHGFQTFKTKTDLFGLEFKEFYVNLSVTVGQSSRTSRNFNSRISYETASDCSF
jgi:hypothetical protein